MTKTIQHQYFFSQTPEVVWDYLTKSELMALWLMPNNFLPIEGRNFEFTTKPIPSLDLDGIFYCKVIEMLPCKKLVYSWKGGPGGGIMTFDTIVVWTLESKENGTELLLVHSGFNEVENYNLYLGMNDGWLKNIKKIEQLLNDKKNDETKP